MSVNDFVSVINQILPEPQAGLLSGILFGTKAALTQDLTVALTKTSTLHIIALSGMNITILTNIVSITLLRFISRRIASLLTIGIIIGFILFVGPSPSVIRAGIMGSISLLAIVLGRQAWSLLSWILAGIIMLVFDLSLVGSISFQLSMLASLGIILFGKKLMSTPVLKTVAGPGASVASKNFRPSSESVSGLGKDSIGIRVEAGQNFSSSLQQLFSPFKGVFVFLWSFIEDDLRVTLAAQVFTVPLLAFQFHQVSFVSPLTNILIGWIIQPLTVLGLVAGVAGYVFLPLGQVVAYVIWVPLTYLIQVVWITSMLPFSSFSW